MELQTFFTLIVILWKVTGNCCSTLKLGKINFQYSWTQSGIQFEIFNTKVKVLTGVLNNGVDVSGVGCAGIESCSFGSYSINVTTSEDSFHILWETKDVAVNFSDCFDFGSTHWYGGPQTKAQAWPVEKVKINGSIPYVLNEMFPSAERYWLNSDGVYIYLNEKVPLFVEQNVHVQNKVCFEARLEAPYINRKRNILEYVVVVKEDPKKAHLHAVSKHLGKPKGRPNTAMIREPIWTTWAKYKTEISDSAVMNYAKEIRQHGYKNGQLEIDDDWETCYGSQQFAPTTFSTIGKTVKELHGMGFRVTLWVHPFVNSDCQNNSEIGLAKGYFVKNVNGSTSGGWWDGKDARQIDFTKVEATEWFSGRLQKLQEDLGIDSFKFDAGETYYPPQPAVYENVDQERVPNVLPEHYLRTCAKFGDLVEVRTAYRTQDLPIFLRMFDKNSTWDENAGLYTLITTLLQLNLNGYTMVLPDMIGGNGYSDTIPDAELLVRWTQANTFMPAMQFSYLPWDITSDEFEAEGIVKKFVDLHANFTPTIIEAMDNSIKYGTPVNAPIWWIDPTDEKALGCDNEFLLGDSILVAPVIKDKARSRDVYLPKGKWKDGNNGSVYEGPLLLENYPAPIDLLPYFSRIKLIK